MLYYEYTPDPYCPVDWQNLRPAASCSLCRDELYLGSVCYRIGAALICEDCLAAYARAYFRACRCTIRAAEPEVQP